MNPIPVLALALAGTPQAPVTERFLTYAEGVGPGAGKHVVLLAGDEEYRSEEALPMLARLLAVHHGFRCTVLFSTDPATGAIDPDQQTHVPGLEALDDADLLVLFFRFRELPDADMKHLVDYLEAGKPVFAIRTSTHAFDYSRDPKSPYARFSWKGGEWDGGFGVRYLGETWVAHHGEHGSQATRGVVEEGAEEHPILRGVDAREVFGPTDVYAIGELPSDATVMLRGAVLAGMDPDSSPVDGPQNDPMMPLVWTREIARENGAPQRTVCSTLGAATDLEAEGSRRVFVNACYWAAGLEEKIPAHSKIDLVGEYDPSPFGFGKARKGVMPLDHALPASGR